MCGCFGGLYALLYWPGLDEKPSVCICLSVVLFQVVWRYFYSVQFGGEHGTLYQLRNLIHRTNVVKKPEEDFNACNDFFQLVMCHILTAALQVLGINSLTNTPSTGVISVPHNVWMELSERQKFMLKNLCQRIVNQFVFFQFHEKGSVSTDLVHMYSKQLLGLGCFFLEYSDAMQEGDGDRVIRCWRYLLPIFKSSGQKNYSIEALQVVYQYQYALTPRQSQQLI